MSTIENAMLGAMMISADALTSGIAALNEDDFTDERKLIFHAIKETCIPDHGASVIAYMETEGTLKRVGGVSKIEDIKNSCVNPDFSTNWARLLRRTSLLRRISIAGSELIKLADSGYSDDLVKQASMLVTSSFSNQDAGIVTLQEAADEEYNRIKDKKEIKKFDSKLASIRSGGGFYAHGDIAAVAGKTGIGKTFFVLREAIHQVKTRSDCTVLFLPLEMSKDALVRRVITQELGISSNSLFECEVNPYQLDEVKTFSERDYLNRFFIARDVNTPSGVELMSNFVMQRSGSKSLFIVIDPAILALPDKVTHDATKDARAFWDGMKQVTTRLSEQYDLVSTLIAHHLTKSSSKEDHAKFTVEDFDTAGHHNISLGLIVDRTANGGVNLHCVKNRHGKDNWSKPMVWKESILSFDDMIKLCPLCAADSIYSQMEYNGQIWICENGHTS